MTAQTIPAFDGKINGSQSETKYQSRVRNDERASAIYKHRLDIDHHNEQRRLERELREVWDE